MSIGVSGLGEQLPPTTPPVLAGAVEPLGEAGVQSHLPTPCPQGQQLPSSSLLPPFGGAHRPTPSSRPAAPHLTFPREPL